MVCGVMAASSWLGSMVKVSGSTSTNTGRAPFRRMASPVAMKVLETVTTSSSGPTPNAFRARVRASVPLATPGGVPDAAPGRELRLEERGSPRP